jgi:histidine phosphotransferase ChpT
MPETGTSLDQALRLTETLCARLCHDLASPLGSLAGAVEVAMEEPEAAEEALAVAAESSRGLGARLRLLRAAWGGDAEALDGPALERLAEGLPPRVRLDAAGLAPAPFPPGAAGLVLNLLLLGAEALPRGGVVSLSGGREAGVVLAVAGPRAAWPEELAGLLSGAETVASALGQPRRVQAPFMALLARARGARLGFLPAPSDGQPAPLRLDFAAMDRP